MLVRPGRSLPEEKNGVIDESYHWPNGEVPYVFFVNDFSEFQKTIV